MSNVHQTIVQGITQLEGIHPLVDFSTDPAVLSDVLWRNSDLYLIMEKSQEQDLPNMKFMPTEVWMPKQLMPDYLTDKEPGTWVAFRYYEGTFYMIEVK